jgi:terminase large subunit-like protein
MILDDWQKEALEHKGDFLLCTGRQVGKTTIMAIKSAERMISQDNCKIIVASLTEDQAKLIIVMVLGYLEKNHKLMIAKGKNKPTLNKIILKNKSQIIARPVGTTGDAIRGFTGDVLILDENSRMNEFIMTAAKPTLLTTGGELWICSTPFGKEGFFYDCFVNRNKRFKVFHITSEEVIKNRKITEDWTERKRKEALKFLENEKADMSELQYGQEYLGLFIDDLQRFFSDDLINKCCAIKRDGIIRGKTYLGVDVAGMGKDKNSLEIIDKIDKENYRQLENITTTKQLTTQTTQKICNLNNHFNFRKIGVDDAGVGFGVFSELLSNQKTRDKVVGLNNASRPLDSEGKRNKKLLKEEMYLTLLNLMEKGKIKLLDDLDLKISLASVQYGIKNEKFIIFGKDTHAVEGLNRAVILAVQDTLLLLWAR